MTDQILKTISAIEPELIAIRHDLHAHPETGFEERRTAGDRRREAARLGARRHRQRRAHRRGRDAERQAGRAIVRSGCAPTWTRSISRKRQDLPYASTIPGKMHACGHDGHTAMLLGAAYTLAQHRDFAGTVHFIFQPAEEGLGGGLAMLGDGLLERFPAEKLYGLHNWPGMPVGRFRHRDRRVHGGRRHLDRDLARHRRPWRRRRASGDRRDGGAGGVRDGGADHRQPQRAGAQAGGDQRRLYRRRRPGTRRMSFRRRSSFAARRAVSTRRCVGCWSGGCGEVANAVAAVHGCTAELHYERIFAPLVNDADCTATAIAVGPLDRRRRDRSKPRWRR